MDLHLREYGEQGPVLVLLHGLFGSSANWGSVARQLAINYRVLVPDLRNHGQSPHHPDASYTAMAGDLLRLLDRQAIGQAILVGHSMGGKVAMCLALKQPQRVSALGVVDIAPVAYAHDHEAVFSAFDAVDLAQLGERADADRQMAQRLTSPALRAFLLQNLVREQGRWRWRLDLAALRAAQADIAGFPELSGQYAGPTRFIHGACSDYLLPKHHEQIAALFPQAGFCTVPGAGHWVYAEQPRAFMHCLQTFLTHPDVA